MHPEAPGELVQRGEVARERRMEDGPRLADPCLQRRLCLPLSTSNGRVIARQEGQKVVERPAEHHNPALGVEGDDRRRLDITARHVEDEHPAGTVARNRNEHSTRHAYQVCLLVREERRDRPLSLQFPVREEILRSGKVLSQGMQPSRKRRVRVLGHGVTLSLLLAPRLGRGGEGVVALDLCGRLVAEGRVEALTVLEDADVLEEGFS